MIKFNNLLIFIKFQLKLYIFIIKGIENSTKAVLFLFGFLNEINCEFKKMGAIKVNKIDRDTGLFSFLVSISLDNIDSNQKKELKNVLFQRDEEVITLTNGIKMLNQELPLIIETFVLKQFDLDEGNFETVIDIGANKGDTALFFASKNYRVIGFEPVKQLYEIAVNNVNLNEKLIDRINLVQKAVSCGNSTVKIFFNEDLINFSGDSSQFADNKSNYELVETISIDNILRDYNIEPYILKMDCEGCEYDIILKSDLSMFKEIHFEYHKGKISHDILIEKLEKQGFILSNKEKILIQDGIGLIKMVKK